MMRTSPNDTSLSKEIRDEYRAAYFRENLEQRQCESDALRARINVRFAKDVRRGARELTNTYALFAMTRDSKSSRRYEPPPIHFRPVAFGTDVKAKPHQSPSQRFSERW